MLLLVPMLLAMTVAAEHPLYLVAILATPLSVLVWMPRSEEGTPLPSRAPPSPVASRQRESIGKTKIAPLAALTTYRAHMMLMTVICILAVDFPVFPRMLAKCETFGVSVVRPHCKEEEKGADGHRWIWAWARLSFRRE